jgi:formylglycine-generating enzyme required for sulfatase activity
MLHMPAGAFKMGHKPMMFGGYGSDFKENEFPQHPVTLSEFFVDRDEVTVKEYAAFLDAYRDTRRFAPLQPIVVSGGYTAAAGFEDRPITFVSWMDAKAFCEFHGETLPTEAQWERAAKGPTGDAQFPWGDMGPDCERTVFLGSSMCELSPARVGSRSPKGDSAEGVRDLAGNVAEWTADWYAPYASPDPSTDPTGPDNADGSLTLRVMRGGSFRDPGAAIRTTARWGADPSSRSEGVGFRCAYRP